MYLEYWDSAPSPPASYFEDFDNGPVLTSSDDNKAPDPSMLTTGLGVLIALAWGGAAWVFLFA